MPIIDQILHKCLLVQDENYAPISLLLPFNFDLKTFFRSTVFGYLSEKMCRMYEIRIFNFIIKWEDEGNITAACSIYYNSFNYRKTVRDCDDTLTIYQSSCIYINIILSLQKILKNVLNESLLVLESLRISRRKCSKMRTTSRHEIIKMCIEIYILN